MKKIIFLLVGIVMTTGTIGQEICNNGIDDDGDGLIDLNDVTDCACMSAVPSLIPNPSFEAMNCCPTGFSQMSCATTWIQASSGTSDYQNMCGMVVSAVSAAGLAPPPDGNGFVGAIYHTSWMEYVGACLSSPMIAGTQYTIQMYVASVPIDNSGLTCGGGVITYGPVNISIWGTTNCANMPFLGAGCPPGTFSVIGSTLYTPVSSWGVVTITFTPSVNITGILLGPPCPLPAGYSGACYPYFLFDDLVLNQTSLFSNLGQTGNWCNNNIVLNGTAVGGATYQWYLNGIALAGQTGVSLNVSAGGYGAGDYSLVTTTFSGCTTANGSVVPEAYPTENLVSNVPVSCNGGNNGSITVSGAGGTPGYIYDIGGATQGSGTFSGLSAGTYNLTVHDVNNCTSTIVVTVTQPTAVGGGISTQTNVSCNGGADGTVTIGGNGGTPGYTYNIGSGPQVSGTFTGLAPGGYSVTVSDANGCSTTVPVTITEPTALNGAIITQTDATCNGGADGSVIVNGSGGTPTYVYDIGSGQQVSGNFNALGAGSYSVTVTDNNGCTYNIPITINQPTAVVGSLVSVIDVLCNGGADGQVVVSASGGSPSYNYDIGWGMQPSGTFNSLSATGYTVTITDANGCPTTLSVTVNEPTAIALTTTNTSSNCGQSDASANVTASGGTVAGSYGYSWEDAVGTQVGTSATVSNIPDGVYTVYVTDDNGCTQSSTVTITDIPGGTATAVIDLNVDCNSNCNGQSTVTMSGGTLPFTYLWSGGGAPASSTNTGLCAGTYNITVTDSTGCVSTDSVVITEPNLLVLSSTVTNENCIGDCMGSITVTGTGGTAPYLYSFDGGSTSSSVNMMDTLCPNTFNIVLLDSNGCSQTTSVDVLPGSQYVDATITPAGPLCESDPAVTMIAVDTGGVWSGTGVNPTTGVFDPLSSGPGSFVLTYTIPGSCGDTSTTTVDVVPSVDATISDPGSLCITDSAVNLFAVDGGGIWSGLGITDSINGIFDPSVSGFGSITVTYIISGVCSDTSNLTMDICAVSDLEFPNVFSPNDDGMNDIFNVIGMNLLEIQGAIFNRWGEKIYEWNTVKGGWDGWTSAGVECADGTYYFLITATGADFVHYEKQGHVTLLR